MAKTLLMHRGEHTLRLTHRDGRFDLVASGGENVTEDEFAQIAAFLEDEDGAEAFLGKLRRRMERNPAPSEGA